MQKPALFRSDQGKSVSNPFAIQERKQNQDVVQNSQVKTRFQCPQYAVTCYSHLVTN